MGRNRILYISQEISPYLPETPLAHFGRYLPQRMQEKGFEVRTFMPKYGCINERRNQLHEVIRLSGINITIDDTDHPLLIKVATLQPARMQVYFIDNEDFFYHTPQKELELVTSPDDNDERMMFFVKGVVETVKKLRWDPAVIHATGWIAALVPLYIRRQYIDDPAFANAKVIYTLRSEKFEGALNPRFKEKLMANHFSDDDLSSLGDGDVEYADLVKLAIQHADAVVIGDDDVPEDLIAYVKDSGKPVYERSGDEETYDGFVDFYNSIIE